MSKNKTITEQEVIALIRAMVNQECSQRKVARILDISDAFLSDVLAGNRPVSERIAHKLGYKRVAVFVPDWDVNHD